MTLSYQLREITANGGNDFQTVIWRISEHSWFLSPSFGLKWLTCGSLIPDSVGSMIPNDDFLSLL